MGIEILAETAQYIVINKAAGLLVEHSPYYPSVEDQVRQYLLTKEPRKEPFVGIVHRLDRAVSGVLLLAKKKSYLKAFNEQFRERKVKKTYLAWVENRPANTEALLSHHLLIDKSEKKSQAFAKAQKGSVEVSLSYKVMDAKDDRYLLEIDLHSGKFHQIRAQLQAIGSPIIGDKKYGSTRDFYVDAIALHACRLEVLEPISGERLVFEAAFPYDV